MRAIGCKVAAECQSSKDSKTRPRATVEVRNDSGQSLLSIAAQNDDVELAQVRLQTILLSAEIILMTVYFHVGIEYNNAVSVGSLENSCR